MSANLEVQESGEVAMFYVRSGGVPWHRTGTSVAEAPTADEARRLAGLDYDTVLVPVTVPGGAVVPGWKAVLRERDGQPFGEPLACVTEDYQPIQTGRAFRFMTELRQDGVLTFDTAGSLNGGRRFWMAAKLDRDVVVSVNGKPEAHRDYLMSTSTHDGSGSFQTMLTRVRAVCANTVSAALREGKEVARVIHSGDVEAQMTEAGAVLKLLDARAQRLTAWQEALASRAVDAAGLQVVSKALFPEPARKDFKTDAEYSVAVLKWQASLVPFGQVYAAEVDRNGPNGYSLAQAVTGYADHVLTVRDGKDGGGRLLSGFTGRVAEVKRVGLAAVAGVTKLPVPA